MYQQRIKGDRGSPLGLWKPPVEPEGLLIEPRGGDRYVVVDDLEGDRAMVVASPWPKVDAKGHLVFSERIVAAHVGLEPLQAAVSQERQGNRQPAGERPLRIGDVFWVRGRVRDLTDADLESWQIVDVTAAARRAARAAVLVAANPALRMEESDLPADLTAQEPDETERREPPPTSAVQAAV